MGEKDDAAMDVEEKKKPADEDLDEKSPTHCLLVGVVLIMPCLSRKTGSHGVQSEFVPVGKSINTSANFIYQPVRPFWL